MDDAPALLRLGLAAGSLPALRKHALLRGRRARKAASTLHLLDTADRGFAAAGWLCLRVEERDGSRTVTLPAAGIALADAPALDLADLLPLATGRLAGSAWTLDAGGVPLQLQAHHVDLSAGAATAGYDALVIQAPPGEAATLRRVVLDLAETLPLRWSGALPLVPAAAELGLVEPPPVRSAAIPFALDEGSDAATAGAAMLAQCLAQFDANLLPVLRDRDVEGVHQMRVALRRLRSALALLAPLLDPAMLAPLLDDLRWLNAPLGAKRDLDVFMAETLQPLLRLPKPPRGLRHLATVLEDRRTAAQAALVSALTAPRTVRLRLLADQLVAGLLDGSAIGDAALAAMPARRFAALAMKKRRRKLRRLGERHAELQIDELHELRIRAKKLRYAAEFFRPLFGRRAARRFSIALAELQDSLGALNDAAVGGALIGHVLGDAAQDPAAAAIDGWFAGRQQLQLARLGHAWEAFAAIRPFWKDALAGRG